MFIIEPMLAVANTFLVVTVLAVVWAKYRYGERR